MLLVTEWQMGQTGKFPNKQSTFGNRIAVYGKVLSFSFVKERVRPSKQEYFLS